MQLRAGRLAVLATTRPSLGDLQSRFLCGPFHLKGKSPIPGFLNRDLDRIGTHAPRAGAIAGSNLPSSKPAMLAALSMPPMSYPQPVVTP